MPLYRLGVFHELSKKNKDFEFTCFGDTKKQAGIQSIPWSLANKVDEGGINWIKTSNYFYIPERLLWQTGIIKRILGSKYDYFIFEGGVFHLPTWLFAILCRIRGKKVLFWTHGFKGFDKGLKKLIRIIYFKLANGLLLYGNYSKKLMIKSGFKENTLFVVYNSLDTKKQFTLLEEQNSCFVKQQKVKIFKNPELFTIIFIGRLVKAKKIQLLLDAVNEFSRKSNPINCVIIGNGPEGESIKKFIATNHLEGNIHMTGALYKEEDICTYFKMSDLMVSPGNVGLNCMHSFAYGVPVLTHDNLQFHGPEAEAITPGSTGLLFENNNYEDMVRKIGEWMNINDSKEEIKSRCHDILLKKYNPVSHAKRIIEAIDQL
ncbi:MAG: glycosyltransferase [Ginsengibacter sp.]